MTELVVPRTRMELSRFAGTGDLIAGGTDLLVQMRDGRPLRRLIDVTNLADSPPLVSAHDGHIVLSAMAPLSHIARALRGTLPAFTAAMPVFGSMQIRNRATIGGNLANASPAADCIPPLLLGGGVASVRGGRGERLVPIDELIEGPGRTTLGPDEWVETVRVSTPQGQEGFRKLGGRLAMAISVVSMAWRWRRDEAGRLSDVRIVLGAVAPVVIRAIDAERELERRQPTPRVVKAASTAARAAVRPIDDVRASARYRREMVGQLLEEALLREGGSP